ncbi:MAG: dienelactone hydrolase family protein [Gemmatimonadetes bacterium]|nr:dienelactone hydrolase family protein [Gemmatimonadota bacterium]
MRARSAFIAIFLTSTVAPAVSARQQGTATAPPVPVDTVWQDAPALFPAVVALPEGYDSTRTWPAILALHGFGGTARGFARIAPVFTRAGYVVVVPEAPYPIPGEEAGTRYSWGLNTWTPPPLTQDTMVDRRSAELTIVNYLPSLLRTVRERYRLGPVYILGFSQGAIYGFLTGFYEHDSFAGIITFGFAGIAPEWFTVRGGTIEDGRNLAVLLVHGREDPMAPFAESERARDMLQAAGYRVTLQPFEGGHSVPTAQLEKVVEWLRSLR